MKFRIVDTEANLVVAKSNRKDAAITDAARKYARIPKTLTIQRQDANGKYQTVATFETK